MCTMLSKWLFIYTIFLLVFTLIVTLHCRLTPKYSRNCVTWLLSLYAFQLYNIKVCVPFCSHINKKTTFTDPRLAFAVEDKVIAGDMSTVKQKFDSYSTAQQVLTGRDLTGKYAIITGANAGICMRNLRGEGCNQSILCYLTKQIDACTVVIRRFQTPAIFLSSS